MVYARKRKQQNKENKASFSLDAAKKQPPDESATARDVARNEKHPSSDGETGSLLDITA